MPSFKLLEGTTLAGARKGLAFFALYLVEIVVFFNASAESGLVPQTLVPGAALLTFLPLIWRRRWPFKVFLASVGISLALFLVTSGYRPMVAMWIALFQVACRMTWRPTFVAILASLAPAAALINEEVAQADPEQRGVAVVLSTVLLMIVEVVVIAVGRAQRANAVTVRDLLTRQLQVRREAIAQERARIARELHDIIAHSVSLMSLQAAGASKILRTEPDRALQSLDHIVDLSQSAINELHRMLGLLDSAEPNAEFVTMVGDLSERIDELVADFCHAGMRVEIQTVGVASKLDASVGHALYRVVQEALTNSIKHGAPEKGPVVIGMEWSPTALRVKISNPIDRVRRTPGAGRGLSGLTERVRAVGGSFKAEIDVDRFRVSAELPVSASGGARGIDMEGRPAMPAIL